MRLLAGNIFPFKKYLSHGWPKKTGDQIKDSCLSSTIGTNQTDHLPVTDIEVELIDSCQPTEILSQPNDFKRS